MVAYIENESLLRTSIASSYTLFAGAGFSVESTGKRGNLPIGSALAKQLRDEFEVEKSAKLSLPQIFTILDRTRPTELRVFLEETYSVETHDPRYKFLLDSPPRSIVTTNVDDLLETIFADNQSHYLNDVYLRGTAATQRAAVDLVKVHGSVRDPNRDMVFAPFDLAAAAANDPDKWHFVREQLTRNPTLFWGYGFNDPGALQAMRKSSGHGVIESLAWVQIHPDDESDALAEYYRALSYNVIISTTSDLLQYFSEHPVIPVSNSTLSKNLGNVPATHEVPSRPLADFLQGAAPIWSDIFDPRLQRTRHFTKISERLSADKNIVIAGIPGCGKTTLLMQMASYYNSGTSHIFLENLSRGEAELLAKEIGSQQATLFLDNIASDVRVIEVLTEPNIQIVGADRDFSINSVGDKLAHWGVEIIGVTDQSDSDLVSIWRHLPQDIRQRQFIRPEISGASEPSIYEFVRSNLRTQSISERLIEHVREISSEDNLMAELLVLSCYLTYARSLLSSDMAIAYFRDSQLTYDQIIDMIDEVGNLLHEDLHHSDDQDYFVARSMIVAEEVIFNSPRFLLRAVLERFHTNVTRLRIPSYDVFQRRAFDSKVFRCAYRSTEEAVDLYDSIMADNPSSYVLQQKALFLNERRQYDRAFKSIEEARSKWYGRTNWSIENSYNKVLFYANLDKADTIQISADQCARALDGLDACFRRDRRIGTHALVYADCALKYSYLERASDSEIVKYLKRAQEMLDIVVSTESYLRRPHQLRNQVKNRLRNFE